MPRPRKKPRVPSVTFLSWFELFKAIFEILAVLAAGYWAFTRFQNSEAPGLEERAEISGELAWLHRPRSDYCLARFGITVKNIGKRAFDLDSIWVSGWQFDRPRVREPIQYLDPANFQSREPDIWIPFVAADSLKPNRYISITGHYPPDVHSHDDYVFSIRKDTSKVMLFRFETGWSSNDRKRHSHWVEFQWDDNCAESGDSAKQE